MNKSYKVRVAIRNLLKTAHSRVWFQRAPSGAQYPYLTFDLPNSHNEGCLEPFILDVDGWDMPEDGDSTALETLMGAVEQALEGKAVSIDDDLSMVIYLDNRLAPQEDDPKLLRRTYVYQVRTYERRR